MRPTDLGGVTNLITQLTDYSLLRHRSRSPRLCSISGWKRREDPTTAGKIDVDLVLVLVQHDGSRYGKEEESSLLVGEKSQHQKKGKLPKEKMRKPL
ncbi:hypothetical protein BHM03_00038801 [Ensete ventricosum]|nr:hypothetical protein BHM03_00038801 [Ensete ventricosum]